MAETLPKFIEDFQAQLEKKGGAFINGSLKEDAEAGVFSAINNESEIYDEKIAFPWLPDFSNVVEKIMAICSDPRTHLKVVKEVKKAEKAVKIDNTDVRMTLRVPRFWREKGNRMLPEYLYSDIFETEYAIYENRFVVTLIDRMVLFISHVIADLYSQVRFLYQYVYDKDIDMPDIDMIQGRVASFKSRRNQSEAAKVQKKESLTLLTTQDSPVVKTLMKLLKLRSDLNQAVSTPFYKVVKKSKALTESDIHITNLLAGDRKYAPCFRFYLNLLSLLAHQHEKESILSRGYINFCLAELLLAYRRLGFKTGKRKIQLRKRTLDVKKLKLTRKNLTAELTLKGNRLTTIYRLSSLEKNPLQKYVNRVAIDIVPTLTVDFPTIEEFDHHVHGLVTKHLSLSENFSNAFVLTAVSGAAERDAIVCSPFFGKIDSNIENMIKSCLTFIPGDKWTYSKICPVCGFYIDGEQENGNCYCPNCDSVYSIVKTGRKKSDSEVLWIKRLHNSERKTSNDESIRLEVIQTEEDLFGEKVTLRLFDENDLLSLYSITKKAGAMEMHGRQHTKDKDDAKSLLTELIKTKGRAIVRKEDGQLVGYVTLLKTQLQGYRRFEQLRIDFFLGSKYWGFGYATDALKTVVAYCFKRLRIDMLWAQCGDFNKAAQRVLAHNNFLFVDAVPDEVNRHILEAKNMNRYVLFNPYPVRHSGKSTPGSTPKPIETNNLVPNVLIEPLAREKGTAAKSPKEPTYHLISKGKNDEKKPTSENIDEARFTPAPQISNLVEKENDPFSGLKNVTFKQKLAKSSEELRNEYENISKYVISYGASSRVSRKYDAYHVGKKRLIVINIRGSHLRIYGAIASKVLAVSTMNVYDDSKTKIYEGTPTFLKVTGTLSYKWAFRFIDEVMKANSISKLSPNVSETTAPVAPAESRQNNVEANGPQKAPQEVVKKNPFVGLHGVSFDEKLQRADNELKTRYETIRDYLVSKGANHHISKKYESFWVGRKTLALIFIRGTHLRVYGAVKIADLGETTMNVYDASKTKLYEDTPSYIKVTGALSLKWAFRFIDEVFSLNQIVKPSLKLELPVLAGEEKQNPVLVLPPVDENKNQPSDSISTSSNSSLEPSNDDTLVKPNK